jgi:hypothetical protein
VHPCMECMPHGIASSIECVLSIESVLSISSSIRMPVRHRFFYTMLTTHSCLPHIPLTPLCVRWRVMGECLPFKHAVCTVVSRCTLHVNSVMPRLRPSGSRTSTISLVAMLISLQTRHILKLLSQKSCLLYIFWFTHEVSPSAFCCKGLRALSEDSRLCDADFDRQFLVFLNLPSRPYHDKLATHNTFVIAPGV